MFFFINGRSFHTIQIHKLSLQFRKTLYLESYQFSNVANMVALGMKRHETLENFFQECSRFLFLFRLLILEYFQIKTVLNVKIVREIHTGYSTQMI